MIDVSQMIDDLEDEQTNTYRRYQFDASLTRSEYNRVHEYMERLEDAISALRKLEELDQ